MAHDLGHDSRGTLGAEEAGVVGRPDIRAVERGREGHLSRIVQRHVGTRKEIAETVGAIRRMLPFAHDHRQISRDAPEDTGVIG